MVIHTKGSRAEEGRKLALELLFSDHRGDCRPPCLEACPANTDCQGYVGLIANGEYKEGGLADPGKITATGIYRQGVAPIPAKQLAAVNWWKNRWPLQRLNLLSPTLTWPIMRPVCLANQASTGKKSGNHRWRSRRSYHSLLSGKIRSRANRFRSHAESRRYAALRHPPI